MKMVTAEEFFDYLQEKYGDHFSSVRGDAAGHWETVKLRVPEAAPKMRQVSSDLPAAEVAATIASLLTKNAFPKFDLAEAWYSLLSFHEHTADSGGGWPGYFSRWDADSVCDMPSLYHFLNHGRNTWMAPASSCGCRRIFYPVARPLNLRRCSSSMNRLLRLGV
jgi:hypothetical protein